MQTMKMSKRKTQATQSITNYFSKRSRLGKSLTQFQHLQACRQQESMQHTPDINSNLECSSNSQGPPTFESESTAPNYAEASKGPTMDHSEHSENDSKPDDTH